MEWVVGVKPMKMKFSGRECAMFQFFVAQEARQSQPEELGQGVDRIFQSDFPLCFLTSFTTFWIIRPPCTFGPYHLLYNISKIFCVSTKLWIAIYCLIFSDFVLKEDLLLVHLFAIYIQFTDCKFRSTYSWSILKLSTYYFWYYILWNRHS